MEQTLTLDSLKKMPLHQIAIIIRKDWCKTSKNGVYFGAKPYIDAMQTMNSIKDNYMFDSGRTIVTYFLANAAPWKGETAKLVKAHLRELTK